MIAFNITVNIFSQDLEEIPRSANFKSAEYADAKKDAQKFVAIFAGEKSRVDYYVDYIIYDNLKRRKASTCILVQDLP